MNPLILLGAIPSALAVGTLAWLLHTVDVNLIEARQRDALQEQATTLNKQCNDKIAATEANNDDFEAGSQVNIDDYNGVVDALGLCKRATIKLRAAAATNSVSKAYTAGKLVHGDVADIGRLIEYGKVARDIQLALISCKRDRDTIEKMNGQ